MKTYVSDGLTIDITASGSDIASGDVVDLGAMIAIAKNDIADGEYGPGQTEGVVTLPKNATQPMTQGAQLYWDGSQITVTATDNTPAGKAWITAGAADTEIDVKLNV